MHQLRDGPAFDVLIGGIGPDLERARAVYRAADAFVSPTWSEGFSNTILEATASGLLVPCRDATALADVRERYRWPVVAGHVERCHRSVLDGAPDDARSAFHEPGRTAAQADPTRRFRRQPHLL